MPAINRNLQVIVLVDHLPLRPQILYQDLSNVVELYTSLLSSPSIITFNFQFIKIFWMNNIIDDMIGFQICILQISIPYYVVKVGSRGLEFLKKFEQNL